MKLLRILVTTDNGPAVSIVEVDPPLRAGEVVIDFTPPREARVRTRPIDEVALAALVEASRR